MQTPPSDPGERIDWLVDRAMISELLVEYARCVDERDIDRFVDLFAEGGELILPVNEVFKRDEIGRVSREMLSNFEGTHHLSANHAIYVDVDTARSRSYFDAAHIPALQNPARHGDVGGWYDCTFIRSGGEWKFETVTATVLWTLGKDLPGS